MLYGTTIVIRKPHLKERENHTPNDDQAVPLALSRTLPLPARRTAGHPHEVLRPGIYPAHNQLVDGAPLWCVCVYFLCFFFVDVVYICKVAFVLRSVFILPSGACLREWSSPLESNRNKPASPQKIRGSLPSTAKLQNTASLCCTLNEHTFAMLIRNPLHPIKDGAVPA